MLQELQIQGQHRPGYDQPYAEISPSTHPRGWRVSTEVCEGAGGGDDVDSQGRVAP